MKYVVTGSAGFIGKALVRHLLSLEHMVIRIDPVDQSGDIRDITDLTAKTKGCNGIFHLGAIASVAQSIKDPANVKSINLSGTQNVFSAAISAGNIPVVYASSSAVYGNNTNLPLMENEKPQPLSPYAEYKLQNEKDAQKYGHEKALPSFGLRIFNVYGEGQNPASPYSGVISIFRDRIARNLPLTVYGDGEQTRDFINIDDTVRALVLAMKHATPDAPIANICSGQSTSLLTLIDTLGKTTETKPTIKFEEKREGDIKYSCGDPSLFENTTGFKTSTSLEHGLQIMSKGLVS